MDKPTVAEIERFWSHVDKTPGQGPKGECWVWMACRLPSGYGQYNIRRLGKKFLSHRFAMIIKHGSIPDGLECLHECDFPACVRDSHLFFGTQAQNIADAVSKQRMAQGDSHWTRRMPELVTRGEAHHTSKISDVTVSELRRLDSEGWMGKDLASKFGISKAQVSRILNGVRRKDTFVDSGERPDRNKRRLTLHPETVLWGEERFNCKVLDSDVVLIRNLYRTGHSVNEIAKQFCVAPRTIRRALDGPRGR